MPDASTRSAPSASVDTGAEAEGALRVLQETGEPEAVLLSARVYQSMLDDLEELRDICRGLLQADAGECRSHEEARAQVLSALR